MNKHKAQLSISRPCYDDDRQKISIRVNDKDARVKFLELEIDLDEFSKALTGLASVPCEMIVRDLENVGKIREQDYIHFPIPDSGHESREKKAIEEAKKHTPEGWTASTYYGSQSSFYKKDGKYYATTQIYRWIEKDMVE